MSVALIIIAGGKRAHLIDEKILPPLDRTGWHDIIVVGEHHEGEGYRYLHVPDMTATTNDALVKRDVGTLTTDADWLMYLSDDHAVTDVVHDNLLALHPEVSAYIPSRWCWRDGERVGLNSGAPHYCGGHGGLFRRSLIMRRPWSTMPHHRNWDVLASNIQWAMGAQFNWGNFVQIEDLETEAEPWR